MTAQNIRVICAQNQLSPYDVKSNAISIINLFDHLTEKFSPDLLILPELALTGYTCDDLFFDGELLFQTKKAIKEITEHTKNSKTILILGTPLATNFGYFNCALTIQDGKILSATPKSYIPNYKEYYEKRFFDSYSIFDKPCQFCLDEYSFYLETHPCIEGYTSSGESYLFTIEICEDLWAPLPPSQLAVAKGASLVINLSASNGIFNKQKTREKLLEAYSYKNLLNYVYCSVGYGEAVNDMVWDGCCFICSNGATINKSLPFETSQKDYLIQDIDLSISIRKRLINKTFIDSSNYLKRAFKIDKKIIKTSSRFELENSLEKFTKVEFCNQEQLLRYPYLHSNELIISNEMEDYILKAQMQALLKRFNKARTKKVVIGVSGGLDSTHALLLLDYIYTLNNIPKDYVFPIVMPALSSSSESQNDALELIKELDFKPMYSPINESVELMLKRLGRDKPHEIFDVTYENVQAGERTSFLFRKANLEQGLVLGTSDLSELALGWCTYGVGDHMSHYAINVGLPKTVVKALVLAKSKSTKNKRLVRILNSILEREISPELLPNKEDELQSSEDKLGKYDVIDFILFHYLDNQPLKADLHELCIKAFVKNNKGDFTVKDVDKAFNSFFHRFINISQFKRTSIPNGPKILRNGSLSPRGDWRAPV